MKRQLIAVIVSIGIIMTALSADASDNKNPQPPQQNKPLQAPPVDPLGAIDINSADAEALSELKGIGPKKAEAIVAYRKKNGPFKSLDDLSAVKGLGEKSVVRLVKNNPDQLIAKR